MTSKTQHYQLTKLDPGEGVHDGDGRFPNADRDTIDAALWAALQHRHSGSTGASTAPEDAPTLTLHETGGTIPASTTVRYVYSILDPDTGETIASPEASVTTPAGMSSPEAPTYTTTTLGGTLVPGNYFYVLSHYEGANTVETRATNALSVTVPTGTSTNSVTLTMPTPDANATGFNIYRRSPNQTRYYYLASVTAATTTYIDDGTVSVDANRTLPSTNATGGTNRVVVSVPTLPGNKTWRLFRTYTSNFNDSLLVQQSSNVTTYNDMGAGTTSGSPPSAAVVLAPSQVDLTTEVQGVLPLTQGGTSATSAADARTNLGLVIGTNVQAYSAVLQATTASFLVADETKLDALPTILRAVKASDEVRTNTTTQVNDTDLFFTTVTNSHYIIEGLLIYSSSSVADITFTWAVPSGATLEWVVLGEADGATTGVLEGPGAAVKRYRAIRGTLTTAGTGGTAALRWAQTTAEATSTTVRARSHLLVTKV